MRCPICEAFVHPLLDRCPFCGLRQEPVADTPVSKFQAAGWTEAEAVEHLSAMWDGQLPDSIRAGAADPDTRAKWFQLQKEAEAKKQSQGPSLQRQKLSDAASAYLEQITYRYAGGLPGVPPGIDVRLGMTGGALTIAEAAGGRALVSAPIADLLAAQVFPENVPLSGWVGLSVGNVAVFTQPTVSGGSLVVTQSVTGQIRQWAVGNKSGLFARKADLTGYQMMLDAIVLAAEAAIKPTLASVPRDEYLRRLSPLLTG